MTSGVKTSFQKGEKRDVRALPLLFPVLDHEPAHPSSPRSPLYSQPEGRGEAGAVQGESRVLGEKQARGDKCWETWQSAQELPCSNIEQPATSQIPDSHVPHCPSIKWQLREQSEETLKPFSRVFARGKKGQEWVSGC